MIQKTIAAIFLLFLFLPNSFSQSYGFFEWDVISVGAAVPSGNKGVKGGFSMATEPRYNISDFASVSTRFEMAFYASGLESEIVDVGIATSIAVMCDLYTRNKDNRRVSVGMGFGRFSSGSSTSTVDGVIVEESSESSIGFVPRAGYEIGALRVVAEYNFAFKEVVANYIGIKFGINFGGRDIG